MPFEPRNARYEKSKKEFLKRDKPKNQSKKKIEERSTKPADNHLEAERVPSDLTTKSVNQTNLKDHTKQTEPNSVSTDQPKNENQELSAKNVQPVNSTSHEDWLTGSESASDSIDDLTGEYLPENSNQKTDSKVITPLSRRSRLNQNKSKKQLKRGKRVTKSNDLVRPMKAQKSKATRGKQQRRPQSQKTSWKRRMMWTLLVLIILVIGKLSWRGISNYQQSNNYSAMQPKNNKKQEVYIPQGATVQQIGQILVNKHLVHSNKAFLHYVSTHDANNMLAGYYRLSPSMPMNSLVNRLLKGGSDTPMNHDMALTMTEGEGIESFAKKVGNSKKFTEQAFLEKVNDQTFLEKLAKKYPKLLTSAMSAKDTRYRLEGYLYPATYDYSQYKTVEDLIAAMVDKTNTEMQPYYNQIKQSNMSMQELMTVASLVQGEGVGDKDMRIIAGVFLNRLDIDMPIQSDVAIKYALQTNRVNLSVEDTMVDSPYNLYRNPGYGPGPMNNPSIQAVQAVLNPKDRSKKYLYFVANLKTGAITYTKNQEDHDAAVAKVDKINQGMEIN